MRTRAALITVRAYVDLPHPRAILIVMSATALFGLLATGGRPDPVRYMLVLVTMLSGQIAIGALNEYCDRELDALAQRHKPIPAGLVTPRAALGITVGGLIGLLAGGAALGAWSLALACVWCGAGLAYDLWLKRTVWSWLPYLVALPLLPIWVWASLDRLDPRMFLLYPLGALMVLAVHLAQSLPDAETDRAAGAHGLAARLGRDRAFLLALGAALASTALVALSGWLLGERRGPALIAAGVVWLVLLATLAARRRGPATVDRQLFNVMGVCAVLLGVGWLLTIAA